jgi:hypothetical protein
MASTRSRLKEGSVNPVQVLNLENFGGGIGAVFSKATIHGDTMSVKLQTLAPKHKEG